MIRKLMHILTGWGKRFGFIPVSKAEVKLADLRMKECGKCDNAKASKMLEIINGNASYENRIFCTICKCPCYEKTIVTDEYCPIGKW